PEKRRNSSSSFPKKGMKKEIQNREKRRKTIKIFMNHYGEPPSPHKSTNKNGRIMGQPRSQHYVLKGYIIIFSTPSEKD
ncbi:MAG: hypothetical protein ACTSWF_07835, partial [Candidatus Freyarchaeota archaeon]